MDEGLAKPILIGRPAVIEARIEKAGLRLRLGADVEVRQPRGRPALSPYWEAYHQLMGRDGITPEAAKAVVRRSNTTIAALMVHLGDADAHAVRPGRPLRQPPRASCATCIGLKRGAPGFATLNALMLDKYTLFIADTYVNEDPSAETLAEHRA